MSDSETGTLIMKPPGCLERTAHRLKRLASLNTTTSNELAIHVSGTAVSRTGGS